MGDEQGLSIFLRNERKEFTNILSTEHSSGSKRRNNTLPSYGNESMNLNPLILTNIQSSVYFKGKDYRIFIIVSENLSECLLTEVLFSFFSFCLSLSRLGT